MCRNEAELQSGIFHVFINAVLCFGPGLMRDSLAGGKDLCDHFSRGHPSCRVWANIISVISWAQEGPSTFAMDNWLLVSYTECDGSKALVRKHFTNRISFYLPVRCVGIGKSTCWACRISQVFPSAARVCMCVCVLFFPIRHRLGSPAPENILGNYFNCSAPTDLTSPNSMDCGDGGCSASGANFSKRIVDCVFLGVWSGLLYILYLLHPPLSIGHCHFNLGLHKTASIPIWLYNTLAGKWLPVLGKHPANYFAICSQALLNLPRMICTCANWHWKQSAFS